MYLHHAVTAPIDFPSIELIEHQLNVRPFFFLLLECGFHILYHLCETIFHSSESCHNKDRHATQNVF